MLIQIIQPLSLSLSLCLSFDLHDWLVFSTQRLCCIPYSDPLRAGLRKKGVEFLCCVPLFCLAIFVSCFLSTINVDTMVIHEK